MNTKPPSCRKRNHVNINLTDDDLEKVRIIQKAHPDLKLDKLFVYSLLKIYGKGNYSEDYNAQYIHFLCQRKEKLLNDIEILKKMLEDKEKDLFDLNEEIDRAMKGEPNE